MKSSNNDKKKNIVSKNDQLKLILEILGDQNQQDTSFISDASAHNYVNTLKSDASKIQFKKEFPFTTPAVLDILEDMLQFNPHYRSNPVDLLKSKVFDSIRRPELEQPAPFQIKLDIDQTDAFDYEECKSTKYSMDQYKQIMINEI